MCWRTTCASPGDGGGRVDALAGRQDRDAGRAEAAHHRPQVVEARAWQEHIADLAREGKASARPRTPLSGAPSTAFGVTKEHWTLAPVDRRAGFVTPMEIPAARRAGAVS